MRNEFFRQLCVAVVVEEPGSGSVNPFLEGGVGGKPDSGSEG